MTLPALESISTPLHDGDTEHPDDPVYADSMYLTASSITIPTIVDASHQPITDRSKVYSGVYGRADISFYTYNTCKAYSARNASNPYNGVLFLHTCFQNLDDLITVKHFVTTVQNDRAVCDTLDHIVRNAQLRDLHHKTKLFHPAFHCGKTSLGKLFVSFTIGRNAPDLCCKSRKLFQTVRHNISVVRQ